MDIRMYVNGYTCKYTKMMIKTGGVERVGQCLRKREERRATKGGKNGRRRWAAEKNGCWGVGGGVTAHCNGELKSDRRGNNPRRSWINPSLTMQIRSPLLSGAGELEGFLSRSEKIKRCIFLAWTGNIGNRCGDQKGGQEDT
jgi:hypothetical protein